jgi:HYR domain-containing protein
MRRSALFVAALLTIACTDDPIAPKSAPRLDATGGRREVTGVTWEKSTTGIDIVPIGLYNGQYTILVDINDRDLAVGWGYANTPEGFRERALSWQNGVFTDLGTLGGNFSRAHQSNNAGVIVGESQDAAGNYRAVVWENGVIRQLPLLAPGYPISGGNAQSINEHGDIAGEDIGNFGFPHAVVWPVTGGVIDLGLLPGADLSRARGINSYGTVFGNSISFSNFIGRATLWTGGTMSEVILPAGGRASSNIATGRVFNDAGDFIAEVAPDAFNFGQAIAFRKGAFETLAMLPNAFQQLSIPYGLNQAGDVVGAAYDPSNFVPVLWSHDGSVTALGAPGTMRAGDAHGINNRGLIVGQAHGEWSPGTFNSGAVLWRISVDITPPTISYSSHAATYAVDEHVSITCTATDAESGIASNSCAPIDGDAYVFGIGEHTFSATATDNAGNTATASTSFTVTVTFSSLSNLTRRFVTKSKVADELVAYLRDAETARARGKTKQAEAALNDYRQGVQAQVGKSITAERGSVLVGLSQRL